MSPATLIAASVVRLSIFCVWLLSPVVLGALAIRDLKNVGGSGLRGTVLPVIAVVSMFAMWCSFLLFSVTGRIGGFGTHYVTTRLADWFLLGSLIALVVSFASKVAKGKLACASILVFALWFGSEMVA